VVEVDKALVAKEKEGRKEEVKEVSMLMMECCKEEGGEGKGSATLPRPTPAPGCRQSTEELMRS